MNNIAYSPNGSQPSCIVVAEVGQAHDGSLGQAHAFIDAIAAAGADAVKFQTHIAAAESTPSEPWRVRFSTQDSSRYEYWKRMEFVEGQWLELKNHADEVGLMFLSSPFSVEAVELLERVGVAAWKIPSGELSTESLLRRVLETGKPVWLSSGMSGWVELDRAVEKVRNYGNALAVLQCTTAYPCPPEELGLNLIQEMRMRYECMAGFSDHSGRIYASLAAATLGAELVEVHVTLSREMFGPDVTSSLTTAELRQVVDGVGHITRARANPVDKDAMAASLAPVRAMFTKSVTLCQALPAGTILTSDHLAAKKPGTGIPAERMRDVVGRRLARNLDADTILHEDDLA